ncbi:MAG: ATP-binding cassette domain-containing protein [Planctomycetaceae bacterium]|nr:ATP-binding cassette domain-containing protein [Planctomycetaceae bacterium]
MRSKTFPLAATNDWNARVPSLQLDKTSVWRDGRRIVGPIDLDLLSGEIKGVYGLNGCGKSTLLRAAGGILRSGIRGSIKWFGRSSLAATPDLLRRIGQQIQSFPVVPHLSVAEQLRLVCQLRNQSQTNTSADLQRIFDGFPELYSKRNERADRLNGGSVTMLSIASAMVGLRNGLLLLDEPTNNLSVSAAVRLRDFILDNLLHNRNAVLVVSHDWEWLCSLMPSQQIHLLSENKRTRHRWKTTPAAASTFHAGLPTSHEGQRLAKQGGLELRNIGETESSESPGPIFASLHSDDLL